MCASYGLQLDPKTFVAEFEVFDEKRTDMVAISRWLAENTEEPVRPTGKNLRNLNPIVWGSDQGRAAKLGWWGFLVGGAPAKFPSINTRSERLADKPADAAFRVLVPATKWFEYQKPEKTRLALTPARPFALAGIARRGVLADGTEYSCYSIVTQEPAGTLGSVHDRMPTIVTPDLYDDWLSSAPADRGLIEAVTGSAAKAAETVRFTPEPLPR